MNISLPNELETFIHEKVESGRYSCRSEMICAALWLLRDVEQLREIRLEELRKEVAIGIEQADRGEVVEMDIEALKAEAHRRHESGSDA